MMPAVEGEIGRGPGLIVDARRGGGWGRGALVEAVGGGAVCGMIEGDSRGDGAGEAEHRERDVVAVVRAGREGFHGTTH